MREVRPLGSTGITPLPRYYEPVRLPAGAARAVMDSSAALRSRPRTSPGLPGPSVALSTRALPTHPGRPDGCVCSLLPHRWQASSPSEEWPPPLVSRGRIGFACAGLTSSPSRRSPAARPAATRRRTDPFRALGYPPAPGRGYMANEQFTWLTPRSQQEKTGLTWRIRGPRRDEDDRHREPERRACRPSSIGWTRMYRAAVDPARAAPANECAALMRGLNTTPHASSVVFQQTPDTHRMAF
jgi:hypothetical protein